MNGKLRTCFDDITGIWVNCCVTFPGRVITGYVYNGTWYEIGKGNPQWPQVGGLWELTLWRLLFSSTGMHKCYSAKLQTSTIF